MSLYVLDGVRPEVPGEGSYFVAPGASVMGKVRLRRDSGIWFGAVLRGDNDWITVGEGSNVQDLSMLHTDADIRLTIGAGCTIGHRAILHGCTIGDNTLVGMGAIILNHAVIGRDCLIGAGALIAEGKAIPDGSLVMGMPGRVVRALTPEEIEKNKGSARNYVKNARRFAAGLSPV